MKRLDRDISRCAGRASMADYQELCADRGKCARYLTIRIDAEHSKYAGYPHSIVADMRDSDGLCRKRIGVSID